jgi:hypothetical protein
MSQPPDDHLKALWQGQETETPTMTVQAIRALARNYGADVRDRFLIGAVLVAVEASVFGMMAWRAPNDMVRLGDLLVLFGLAFLIWRARARWPSRLPDTQASVGSLLDFHRAELERQRTSYGGMILSVGPMIVGLLVIVYGLHVARPHAGPKNFAPFFVLMALWFVAAWFVQRRQARRLQGQIDEVDALRGG